MASQLLSFTLFIISSLAGSFGSCNEGGIASMLLTTWYPFSRASVARSFSITDLASISAVITTINIFLKDLPFIFSEFTQTPAGSFEAEQEANNVSAAIDITNKLSRFIL